MNTRRELLKGVSSLAFAAAGTKTAISMTSKGSETVDKQEIVWPKPIGSPVLDSLRPVIEHSRDVSTHPEKIREIAGWMAYEDLPMPKIAVPYGLDKTPDVAIDFVMVANTIDSAFTDFDTHVMFQTEYQGERVSDADAMIACLKRAMDDGVPILDGKFLSGVSKEEMRRIFKGNIEMPMLDEKVEVLHQAGLECEDAENGARALEMIQARPFDEDRLLRAAAMFQRGTDWHTQRPSL